jgi:hypothetical protein
MRVRREERRELALLLMMRVTACYLCMRVYRLLVGDERWMVGKDQR